MNKLFFAAMLSCMLFACKKEDLIKPTEVIASAPSAARTTAIITLPKNSSNQVYIKDASYILPGSKIVLEGTYKSIYLKNLNGTPDNPIIIINKGAVQIGGYASYTCIITGSNFKVLGNGDSTKPYGIQFNAGGNPTLYPGYGINVGNSTNVEIAYTEYYHLAVGIMQNPASGNAMENIYYHHNYMHDFADPAAYGRSEGFYLGNTSGSVAWNGTCRFINARIENNLIENTTGDGIQVANGTFTITNNVVRKYGQAKLAAQWYGILLGGYASGTVTYNTIDQGITPPIFAIGMGNIEISNNIISNTVLSASNLDMIYINARVPAGGPKMTLKVSNNTVSGSSLRFGIADLTSSTSTLGGSFTGNKISGTYKYPYAITSMDSWTN